MTDDFVERKHGRKKVEYPLPMLEPILKSTYGTVVYQEQVMQIAQVLAGYSLGDADLLRRAMGKKDVAEMEHQKTRFVEGAIANEIDGKLAEEIFDLLAYFAGYGFNKSHSAAYGAISYQTAWLKAHHRSEYMAALMSIEANNSDKVLLYIGDCKHAGLEILPPDVNVSLLDFDVPADDRGKIRFGLGAVKGLGATAVSGIVDARQEAGGRFSDWMDCLENIDHRRVNKKALESLVKCGAFDWTGIPRRVLFEGLSRSVDAALRTQADRDAGQVSLFGGAAAPPTPEVQLPDLGEWPMAVKLRHERDALGFFISGHPVRAFSGILSRITTCPISGLEECRNEANVSIAGMVSAMRQIRTRAGYRMAFCTIEDPHGSVECVF
ncbi:MAG: DNA polymerase III subunit alpha, partial [Myxococcota bacterium]|nr:DNA polymerase III subunit alpha [Myxococcota bacterium]